MKRLALTGLLLAAAASTPAQPIAHEVAALAAAPPTAVQGTSLRGRPLMWAPREAARATELHADLAAALRRLAAEPASEEALIAVGRNLAWLNRFREAIDVYRLGLQIHPGSAMLHRHRGHRLITLRRFEEAARDLRAAAALLDARPDASAADQREVWYHLGLALYLMHDFGGAVAAFERCHAYAANDDQICSSAYWRHMALRRLGRDAEAEAILAPVHAGMAIDSSVSYHELLLVFRGDRTAEETLDLTATDHERYPTVAYGLGFARLAAGDEAGAAMIFERIVNHSEWSAFGHIAAETELAGLGVTSPPARSLDLGGGESITLVRVPGGTFTMGATPGDAGRDTDELPPTRVLLTRALWLGESEVTVGQFRRFVAETGHMTEAERAGFSHGYGAGDAVEPRPGISWRNPGFPQRPDEPVVCVSWNDAVAFCAWLSRRTGEPVTLPTEAQWEYVARAGDRTIYPWGNRMEEGAVWGNFWDESGVEEFPAWDPLPWNDGFVHTAPVRSFRSNPLGVYDISGNVWEWCLDGWTPALPGEEIVDPVFPENSGYRARRGASWYQSAGSLRVANRGRGEPDFRINNRGFRVCVVEGR